MEFRVLGPLEVRVDGRVIELGGPKPRALLAVLLLHANEPVSAERLALALWGEEAQAEAVKRVQVNVSRLRRALGDSAPLETSPSGYVLRVRAGALDLERFEHDVAGGREALDAGDGVRASDLLRKALALWRGPPLADLVALPFAAAEIARFEEQRLDALELRIDADLASGRHRELVAELERLVAEHPWREGLHGRLMLALYRSGRQAEALDVYRDAREVLVEELGIEPGVELVDLQGAILAHAPELGAPERTPASTRQSRVPAPANRTIGREGQLAEISERVRAGSARLLTLTGPGGVGKTRLALEVARAVRPDFPDGVGFVALDAVPRASDVPLAIVRALDVVVLDRESPAQAVLRQLTGRQSLLVLDNCEHVLETAPFVGDLVAAAPALTVLATSREPLAIQAEQCYPVPPLALSGPGASGEGAVALFAERARVHDPHYELGDGGPAAVIDICRRLDGLPLAIELAAARCALLSPREIAQRLDSALGAAARDVPARQRTLTATIDWSYALLDGEEKAAFARFAVFAGGATVDAAEVVTRADLDVLDHLVSKNLLVRRRLSGDRTRLSMLETIRTYAGRRFAEDGDAGAVRERHRSYYLELAWSHANQRALWMAERKQHLAVVDADIENLHTALAWTVARADARASLQMCAALAEYWMMRDRYADALEWIRRSLELRGAEDHAELRVRALATKAWAEARLGRGIALGSEAEAAARRLQDPVLLSDVLRDRAVHEGNALHLDHAAQLADEALEWAQVAGDDWRAGMAVLTKTIAARSAAELRAQVDDAVERLERTHNVYGMTHVLASAAYGALCHGSDGDALEFVLRATPIAHELDNRFLWMLLRGNAGLAALFTGDIDAAEPAFREELETSRELAVPTFAAESLRGLAAIAAVRGELERAAWLFGAAETQRQGEPHDLVDERLLTRFFEPARTRLGPEAWDEASRLGAQSTFADAVAAGLKRDGRLTPADAP